MGLVCLLIGIFYVTDFIQSLCCYVRVCVAYGMVGVVCLSSIVLVIVDKKIK